jgi:tetratricopeptide (TPR) repeat protein
MNPAETIGAGPQARQRWRYRTLLVLAGVLACAGTISYRPIWATYHYWAAGRARGARDFATEHQQLLACLQVWDGSARTHLLTARAARRLSAYDEAEEQLTRCAHLGAGRDPSLGEELSLERVLLHLQRHDQEIDTDLAVTLLQEDVPLDSLATLELLEGLSGYCMSRFRLDEARGYLDQWIQRDPNSVRALLWHGWVMESLTSSGEAVLADYEQAVRLDPRNDVACLRLAEALLKTKHPEEALKHLDSQSRLHPDNPLVLFNLALAHENLGDHAEAATLLDRVLIPERLQLVERLSDRLRALQEPGTELTGTEWYRDTLSLAPYGSLNEPRFVVDLHVQALTERGKLAAQAKKDADARALFERAVRLDAQDYQANYQLALCLDRLGEHEAAKRVQDTVGRIRTDQVLMGQLIEQVRQFPHSAAPRYGAGVILLRNGQPQEALRWLASAVQEDPRHAAAHRLLADLYDRAGDATRAAYHRRQLPLDSTGLSVPPGMGSP